MLKGDSLSGDFESVIACEHCRECDAGSQIIQAPPAQYGDHDAPAGGQCAQSIHSIRKNVRQIRMTRDRGKRAIKIRRNQKALAPGRLHHVLEMVTLQIDHAITVIAAPASVLTSGMSIRNNASNSFPAHR
jgi:hypothetical protein